MSNYLICTPIPYVNGEPHLGHAMEFVMADVLARRARTRGDRVIYTVGTDEHGGKIAEKAAELGLQPQAFVDKMVTSFVELQKRLNISADRFVRTTDPNHQKRAQLIWEALKNDIYKSTYIGLYCTGCEEFVSEQEAKHHHGVCPRHNRPYERLEEENYFFALSKYSQQVNEAIQSDAIRVVPETRRNEILALLREGLEDISISRPKAKLSWGIPVPGDSKQVMYVWFEALLNYITVLGYPEGEDFKKFWPANLQIVGKDILRFHAAVWPGILLALGQSLPRQIYVHGFINVNGQKMSKSLGNDVSPNEIIDRYGADVFRYFFLRHMPSYEDGDFTWERLEAAYNNELADQLGNAVNRTAAMILRYQEGIIGDIPPGEHDEAAYHEALEVCRFDRALDDVWEQVRGLNQYVEETKPWEIAAPRNGTRDEDHLREVLAYMAGSLLQIAGLLAPFMPETAARIEGVFKDGFVRPLDGTLFPKAEIKTL